MIKNTNLVKREQWATKRNELKDVHIRNSENGFCVMSYFFSKFVVSSYT